MNSDDWALFHMGGFVIAVIMFAVALIDDRIRERKE